MPPCQMQYCIDCFYLIKLCYHPLRALSSCDLWDKGRYQAVSAIDGLKDFVGQVLPKVEERASGGLGKQAGVLLRRAKDYEIRFFQVWRQFPLAKPYVQNHPSHTPQVACTALLAKRITILARRNLNLSD